MLICIKGLPTTASNVTAIDGMMFPNRLIKAGLSTLILESTDMKKHDSATMRDIRNIFEAGLKDRQMLKKALNGNNRRALLREE